MGRARFCRGWLRFRPVRLRIAVNHDHGDRGVAPPVERVADALQVTQVAVEVAPQGGVEAHLRPEGGRR